MSTISADSPGSCRLSTDDRGEDRRLNMLCRRVDGKDDVSPDRAASMDMTHPPRRPELSALATAWAAWISARVGRSSKAGAGMERVAGFLPLFFRPGGGDMDGGDNRPSEPASSGCEPEVEATTNDWEASPAADEGGDEGGSIVSLGVNGVVSRRGDGEVCMVS
jgi:hypothetical protein